jgi:hypothetical protein
MGGHPVVSHFVVRPQLLTRGECLLVGRNNSQLTSFPSSWAIIGNLGYEAWTRWVPVRVLRLCCPVSCPARVGAQAAG